MEDNPRDCVDWDWQNLVHSIDITTDSVEDNDAKPAGKCGNVEKADGNSLGSKFKQKLEQKEEQCSFTLKILKKDNVKAGQHPEEKVIRKKREGISGKDISLSLEHIGECKDDSEKSPKKGDKIFAKINGQIIEQIDNEDKQSSTRKLAAKQQLERANSLDHKMEPASQSAGDWKCENRVDEYQFHRRDSGLVGSSSETSNVSKMKSILNLT